MNRRLFEGLGEKTGGAVGAGLLLGLLAGCVSPDAAAWQARWNVPLEELAPIFQETNCGRLETAIADRVGDMAGSDRDEHLVHSVAVQAAFHRMVILDCDEAYRR
jgi:hypothetical protein